MPTLFLRDDIDRTFAEIDFTVDLDSDVIDFSVAIDFRLTVFAMIHNVPAIHYHDYVTGFSLMNELRMWYFERYIHTHTDTHYTTIRDTIKREIGTLVMRRGIDFHWAED